MDEVSSIDTNTNNNISIADNELQEDPNPILATDVDLYLSDENVIVVVLGTTKGDQISVYWPDDNLIFILEKLLVLKRPVRYYSSYYMMTAAKKRSIYVTSSDNRIMIM